MTKNPHWPHFTFSRVISATVSRGFRSSARQPALVFLFPPQETSSERELEMPTDIARIKRQLAERDEELAILQNEVA